MSLRRAALLCALTLGLAACGGGGGSSSVSESVNYAGGEVVFSGSIGDGPVTGANVDVKSASGEILGTIRSDNNAAYRASVTPTAEDYPILLKVYGGTDLVTGQRPDFQMESVQSYPQQAIVNVNPFSTLITYVAKLMPGALTFSNVNAARALVMNRITFGVDPSALADPISSWLTTTNVAMLVKASEGFGEAIRRTRDRLQSNGWQINGDDVMKALAADMTDGHPDGLGVNGTNPRVTAVFNIVSAQVIVELLSNNLRVNGVIATNVIDQSILSTNPGITANQLTSSVRISSGLLAEARTALAAVQAIDGSSAVAGIVSTVNGLYGGATAGTVASVLPANSTNSLYSATNAIPGASTAQVNAVNQAIYAQGESESSYNTGGGSEGGSGSTGGNGSSGGGGSTGGNGSFSLTWTAPTARSDGSSLSLSEIDGYRVYYGSSRGNYPNVYDQTNGSATSATVSNLASGTYYLVMTTYDSAGRESSRSSEVSKFVP